MADEPWDLFDELVSLQAEWQVLAEEYRRHAVLLFDSCWAGGADVVDADLVALGELSVHIAQVTALDSVISSLDALLEVAEAKRQERYRLSRRGLSTARVADDARGGEPF